MNEELFLKTATKNSIVVLNDWVYVWRPEIKDGTLIATDNDSSDIELKNINFTEIQEIRETKKSWSKDNYEFLEAIID